MKICVCLRINQKSCFASFEILESRYYLKKLTWLSEKQKFLTINNVTFITIQHI